MSAEVRSGKWSRESKDTQDLGKGKVYFFTMNGLYCICRQTDATALAAH